MSIFQIDSLLHTGQQNCSLLLSPRLFYPAASDLPTVVVEVITRLPLQVVPNGQVSPARLIVTSTRWLN